MYQVIILWISIYILAACSSPSHQESAYGIFNIDSLLQDQSNWFTSHDTLIKTVQMSETTTTVKLALDPVLLNEEFKLFKPLQVFKKKGSINQYKIHTLQDDKSNLMIRSVSALNGRSVQNLRIYFQKQNNVIRRIESITEESNAIFQAQDSIILEFDQKSGKSRLSSYSIHGFQKTLLSSPVHFHVHAKWIRSGGP